MTITLTSLGTNAVYNGTYCSVSLGSLTTDDWIIAVTACDVTDEGIWIGPNINTNSGSLTRIASAFNSGNTNVFLWIGRPVVSGASNTLYYSTSSGGDTGAVAVYKATNLSTNGTAVNLDALMPSTSTSSLVSTNRWRYGNRGRFSDSGSFTLSWYLSNINGASAGTLYARVRSVSDDSILHTFGSLSVTSVGAGGAWYGFTSGGSYTPTHNQDIYLTIEVLGSSVGIEVYNTKVADAGFSLDNCGLAGFYTPFQATTWNQHSSGLAMQASGTPKLVTPLDKTASATGTSGSPSSGATATLTQADELVIGAIGMEHKLTESTGSWTTGTGNVSGNEQSDGTSSNGSAANQVIRSAAEVVSATTAQTAAITGEDSADWAALIVTLLEAAPAPTFKQSRALLGVGW